MKYLLTKVMKRIWPMGFMAVHVISAPSPAHKELTLLNTGDMHARVLGVMDNDTMCTPQDLTSEKCFGGFARIATQVSLIRKTNKFTVLVDAGDQFQGSIFHSLYLGLASARFMNEIGYDGMAVGNHELDNGNEALARFASALNFPLLSANIDAREDPALKDKIKPYVIIRKNGLRIGLVGYTTEDTAFLSAPGPKLKFLPIVPSLKKAVLALKRAKVDVIIALSHAGLARDIKIASEVDGIAAIACGHSNSLLSNKVQNSDGPCPLVVKSPNKNPVLLVSAYAYGKYLGYLHFTFDAQGVPQKWSGEPILLDQRVQRSQSLSLMAEKLYEPARELEKEQVGVIPVDIDSRDCRFKECIFGNFIADSMLDYSRQFGVSIALMNAGGIRASIPKGAISQAQIKDVLPFQKKIVLVKISGRDIQKILEHGVSFAENKGNDNTGRFLQVAGLKYSFDSRKPRGHRVSHILVFEKDRASFSPLDANKIYGVAINSYMAQGGDNYTFFAQASERWNLDLELRDLLNDFIKSVKAQLPRLDGRIIDLANATKLRLP